VVQFVKEKEREQILFHFAYRILVGKPEGKRPLGRTRRRGGGDNIKMDLREIEWDGMDWIDLA
jgi:hypothetical protein